MDQVKKFVCASCNTKIPTALNESTGQLEPQNKVCPNCQSSNITTLIEEFKPDNRQILNG